VKHKIKVIRGRTRIGQDMGRPLRSPAIALGNFDGVHRGHLALLELARTRADAHGGDAGVVTFDPHPAQFFSPNLAPPLIMPLARRLELCAHAGMDFVLVEPFNKQTARMEAEDFVKGFLARDLTAHNIVVGHDFHFGKGRRGDPTLLAALGDVLGIDVDVVAPVSVGGVPCSSTKIREFVLEGRVEGARLLLGRPFEITGLVVEGDKRGRTIGFPTANIISEGDLMPRTGVYSAWAYLVDESGDAETTKHASAVNIGTNPTFARSQQGKPLRIEAHLIDFVGNLYGKRLRLELLSRLRDERRFDDVAQLTAQIRQDVIHAKEHCK
jgi:riboflavin kinase / FMN adenylyltransferase